MFKSHMLQAELEQREQEGYDLRQFRKAYEQSRLDFPEKLDDLYNLLQASAFRDDFPFEEPDELEQIRALRPSGPRSISLPDPENLEDRLLGAWIGRAIGCQMGKPVEGLSSDHILTYLQAAEAYPLTGYVPFVTPPDNIKLHPSATISTLGNFDCMSRDDDIDYTLLGLYILETYGIDFTTDQVGETWLNLLPYRQVFTAERVAYRNLINGAPWNYAAVLYNPYREWIGALIRADTWGYALAGYQEQAAEMAWRDAYLSHRKNGIYGEMWAAATIAAAFTELSEHLHVEQIIRLIKIGLSEIPANCRLAHAFADLLIWHETMPDWQTCLAHIQREYGHYHRIHVINNALLIGLGLLYGKGDFVNSVAITVMAGWDTDSNAATVGSILGAVLGFDNLPQELVAPLNGRTRSAIPGFDHIHFEELAFRSREMQERLRS